MSVVALIRVLIYILMLTISFFWGDNVIVIGIFLSLNLALINIMVWTIYTNLSWSFNLYNFTLYQIIITFIIIIISFAFIYRNISIQTPEGISYNFIDCLNLSLSMFTGLGFSDIHLTKYRIITSLQAFIGLCYLPILAAYIWMFIQSNIRNLNIENEEKAEVGENEVIRYNFILGVHEISEDEDYRNKRNEYYNFNACKECKNNTTSIIAFIKLSDLVPYKNFLCQCETCGNFSKNSKITFLAVRNWNKENPKTS